MTAVFLAPQRVSVAAASQSTAAPATNALVDPAGLVWRSNGLSGVYATFIVTGAFDSIALTGTNLRATDTVHVRTGGNAEMTNPQVDRTVQAWTGAPGSNGAITYVGLETTTNGPYVRIDIVSTGNPAGYVEVQRVVIGKRVEVQAIDSGASQGFEDASTIEDINGMTLTDVYRVRDSWKFTVSDTTRATYATQWYPLLKSVGKHRALLFVPDTTSPYLQTEACLAYVTGSPKGDSQSSDFWKMDINLLSV